MAGSVYGKHFSVTTWGESHGPALGCVVDGCPAGLSLDVTDIQPYLDRRKPGTSSVTTARSESDTVEILSGTFEGLTTGTPISLMIRNRDQHSNDYGELAVTYRPGHADYCFDAKFGIRDHRGGGRSSGRETAARVAAGAIAQKILSELGIRIHAYTLSIGDVSCNTGPDYLLTDAMLKESLSNPVGMPDAAKAEEAFRLIESCREKKDSVGGTAVCTIEDLPAGLGSPVFDKLDAALSHALFSVGAVKAVEIGDGISVSRHLGSENNDAMYMDNGRIAFRSNHSGGILGGISSGAPVTIRAHFKPTPSIYRPQETVKKDGTDTVLSIVGRHDPVIVPRAVVVVECMCALTVLDALMEHATSRMAYLDTLNDLWRRPTV